MTTTVPRTLTARRQSDANPEKVPAYQGEKIMAEKRSYDGSATCSGCSTRWTAKTWCHCGACHETFSGLGYFDAHRVGGCHTPPAKDARLVDGTWRGPEWDAKSVFAA